MEKFNDYTEQIDDYEIPNYEIYEE